MSTTTFAQFESAAKAEGFDEVLERRWGPDAVVGVHTHPFAVRALMVEGELWLTVDSATRHLRSGDHFELPREVPHAERYGSEGALFWVARRHGDGPAAR